MAPKKADPKKPDAKAQKAMAKASSGGGKQKKKKWSKGKNKEKTNNAILFTKESFEKMLTEVPKMKMVTISILSDRLRINCSLARRAMQVLIVRARSSRGGAQRLHSAAP
jgi:small subunit ribosomal protein S25e